MRVNLEYLENKIYLDRTTFNYFVGYRKIHFLLSMDIKIKRE